MSRVFNSDTRLIYIEIVGVWLYLDVKNFFYKAYKSRFSVFIGTYVIELCGVFGISIPQANPSPQSYLCTRLSNIPAIYDKAFLKVSNKQTRLISITETKRPK